MIGYLSEHKKALLKAFLTIVYIVGVVGMYVDRPSFVSLTALNLLVSIGVVIFYHWLEGYSLRKLLVLFGVVYTLGYLVEVIGVATGLLFGEYCYGASLGVKWLDTPLMIGVNWFMLIYCSGVFVNKYWRNKWVKIALGATVMVVLDFFIEPVAPVLDLWSWGDANEWLLFGAPLQNYIAWWLIAWVMHCIYQWLFPFLINSLGELLLYLQFVFFIVLNVII